jgi:hypothetical protein
MNRTDPLCRLLEPERPTWLDYGRVGQANKWVTLNALQALRGCSEKLTILLGMSQDVGIVYPPQRISPISKGLPMSSWCGRTRRA